MTESEFYGWAIPQLIEAGITVKLVAKKTQGQCRGCFDSDKLELMTAYKNPIAFQVFIHEFCHFLQWRDSLDWWNKYADGVSYVFGWLDGKIKPKSQKELNDNFDLAVALELDCEKRALKLIKDLDLPVDTKVYSQKANAYLAMYALVKEFGIWPGSHVSTYCDEISQHYPKKLQTLKILRSATKIPKEAKSLLLKHCFKS